MIQVPFDDLLAHADDEVALRFRQHACRTVGPGGSHLQVAECAHHLDGHAALGSDGEVVTAALSLGAPILIGGHGHFAERILFNSGIHVSWIERSGLTG